MCKKKDFIVLEEENMEKVVRKKVALCLALCLSVTLLGACGTTKVFVETNTSNIVKVSSDTVNIGFSDTIGSLNPLLMDGTEVEKYAQSMEFLPLVELGQNMTFQGQLATSIETQDNTHFTIHLDPQAVWSDGEQVTADDVLYTFLCWVSPKVGNTGNNMNLIEGVGDDGYIKEGETSISGVQAVDHKTVQITTKQPMSLNAFENVYGRYVLILPKHALENIPQEKLLKSDWFFAPTVVSGPYFAKKEDLNHYVKYEANPKYFKGAPKIKNVNIKIVSSSQLLAGLESGEIDVVQQTTGTILQQDYKSVQKLKNVTTYSGSPVTNQSIFINTKAIDNVKVRQALLCGIDRKTILEQFLDNKGEIVDGFLSSAGPYYDSSLKIVPYNAAKAKKLIQEAKEEGFDTSKQYTFYINSGDTTFTQIAEYIQAQMQQIGLNLQIKTVDLTSLMAIAAEHKFDFMAVQYTYTPVDPYTDITYLLNKDGWTAYQSDSINQALAQTQTTTDKLVIKNSYLSIDQEVQKNVPMISAYIISALGAVNHRMQHVTPDVYGTFMSINQWEIKQ